MRLTVFILSCVIVGEEDLLDGQTEDARNGEGQGQGGVIATGLQGIDRLTGDTQLLCEAGLSPAALSAQHLEIISHRYRQVDHSIPTPKKKAHMALTHMRLTRGAPTSSKKL